MTRARDEPLRVLAAHPGAELYGSDLVFLETVRGLVGAGITTVVALPGPGPLEGALRGAGARVARCSVPVLRKSLLSPAGAAGLAASVPQATRRAHRLLAATRPDLVWVNTLTIPLWLPLARARRIPTVCHVHEAEGDASALIRRALATPLLLADRVVANSRYSASVLATSAPSLAGRTVVVPNAVEGVARPAPPRAELEGPLRVVYVGRLSPRKGVDVLVEAVGRVRERRPVVLDVVGSVFDGYEWFADRLASLVDELGLGQAVRFHGYRRDTAAFLAAADVVAVPSVADEPFGNTAVEAILAERPVVASGAAGLLEATDGYRSAFRARPGDPGSLADALLAAAGAWPRIRDEIAADRALAEERHSPGRYRATVAETARTTVAARRRGRAAAG